MIRGVALSRWLRARRPATLARLRPLAAAQPVRRLSSPAPANPLIRPPVARSASALTRLAPAQNRALFARAKHSDATVMAGDGAEELMFGDQTQCTGCGARLQSVNPDLLGYIPSSKLLARDTEHESPEPSTEEESIGQRKASSASALVCQRCYALKHYNKVLPVHVAPDDFKRHLALLKKKKALVVHVVDLFDFPGSVYPALSDVIGDENPVLLAANKADLLMKLAPDWIQRKKRVHDWLRGEAERLGIGHVRDIVTVSAQTGMGMMELRRAIEEHRDGRDVYFVGCTNAGKSSIINRMLLEYQKQGAGKTARIPTVSQLPGTTLSLIAFPLVPPGERGQFAAPVKGTFVYDTPGIVNPNQLVHLLKGKEVKAVSPSKAPVPRTFLLKPGQCLFLGGLARIDYVDGPSSAHFTVFAGTDVNAHPTSIKRAEEVWKAHAGLGEVLSVPLGGPERMESFPALEGKDFELQGIGVNEGCADIVLSGAGWVSVAAGEGANIKVRGYTPGGIGLCQRSCLAPDAVKRRGKRVKSKGQRQRFRGK